jgi:hypothetical protein
MSYFVSFNGLGYAILNDKREEVSPTFDTEKQAREYLSIYFK